MLPPSSFFLFLWSLSFTIEVSLKCLIFFGCLFNSDVLKGWVGAARVGGNHWLVGFPVEKYQWQAKVSISAGLSSQDKSIFLLGWVNRGAAQCQHFGSQAGGQELAVGVTSLYRGFYLISVFRTCTPVQIFKKQTHLLLVRARIWVVCMVTFKQTHTLAFRVSCVFEPESPCPCFSWRWVFQEEL